MLMNLTTPLSWRKDWKLYRSTSTKDSRGNMSRKWDTDTPDFVGKAGTVTGVCWQIKGSEWALKELGEKVTGAATFDLYLDALDIQPFDRCAFGGSLWEVREVLPRSNHRHIRLVEVRAL